MGASIDMNDRVYLKVQNFGPLAEGTSKMHNGAIEIPKFSIFIGDQGTGKSTLAKLFSSFSWLEKAFVRQYYDEKKFDLKDFSILIGNQNIPHSYVNESTCIEYTGQIFEFSIHDKKFRIRKKASASYFCPQIQYVPSERNLIGVIDNFWDIKGLPEMVNELSSEFLNASRRTGSRRRRLFTDYIIKFDPKTQRSFIEDESGKSVVPLNKASSGLQSIAPLIVVTEYLAKKLKEDFFKKLKDESVHVKDVAMKAVAGDDLELKLSNFFASGITSNFSDDDLSALKQKLYPYVNSCLWEIVEEPEQNLFPTSQVEIVKKLIESVSSEKSKLVMTTHSPYILSVMNNFIFAEDQFQKFKKTVPGVSSKYFIGFDDIKAYKIEDGSVRSIMDDESRMIDVSEIDGCSEEINRTFDSLFRIGD